MVVVVVEVTGATPVEGAGAGAAGAVGAVVLFDGCTQVAGVAREDGATGGAVVVGVLTASSRWSWRFTSWRCATREDVAGVVDGVAVDEVAAVTLTAPAVSPPAQTAPRTHVVSGFTLVHLSSSHRLIAGGSS